MMVKAYQKKIYRLLLIIMLVVAIKSNVQLIETLEVC